MPLLEAIEGRLQRIVEPLALMAATGFHSGCAWRGDLPAVTELSAWANLAAAKLLSFDNTGETHVPRDLLIQHTVQICETILVSQVLVSERPKLVGGSREDGRTTPTATRLEGLQLAITILPHDHEIRHRIQGALPLGISFLLRLQVGEGEFDAAIPWAIGRIEEDIQHAGGFDCGATEVRIDDVQHAPSAMIQYLTDAL
jgi:hypothetical protein